jgi:hypothetical protein
MTTLWSCPDCAFTFDAVHTDGGGATAGYSCPACAETRLAAQLAASPSTPEVTHRLQRCTVCIVEVDPEAKWVSLLIVNEGGSGRKVTQRFGYLCRRHTEDVRHYLGRLGNALRDRGDTP